MIYCYCINLSQYTLGQHNVVLTPIIVRVLLQTGVLPVNIFMTHSNDTKEVKASKGLLNCPVWTRLLLGSPNIMDIHTH